MSYDSKPETKKHIRQVRKLLGKIVYNVKRRADLHDSSKLASPEVEMYDEFTPKLRALTYGSDEYKQCLQVMGSALQHHYQCNSHHPEHFRDGIDGMSLLDLIEMLADWAAAVQRHDDGNLTTSISINKKRFGMSGQLAKIFVNTAMEMGWIK